MAKTYQMIRVETEIHARLAALRRRLEDAYVKGYRNDYPTTLSDLIAELIEHKEKHMARSNKKKPTPTPEPPLPDPLPDYDLLAQECQIY